MSATMERLVMQEQQRREQEQRQKETTPTDQYAQFRVAVRAVLTILLDKNSNAEDRVARATDILLGLPVPMPQTGVQSHISDDGEYPLYLAGVDGLPTTVEYVPETGEGPLTEEEGIIMLREQREG